MKGRAAPPFQAPSRRESRTPAASEAGADATFRPRAPNSSIPKGRRARKGSGVPRLDRREVGRLMLRFCPALTPAQIRTPMSPRIPGEDLSDEKNLRQASVDKRPKIVSRHGPGDQFRRLPGARGHLIARWQPALRRRRCFAYAALVAHADRADGKVGATAWRPARGPACELKCRHRPDAETFGQPGRSNLSVWY